MSDCGRHLAKGALGRGNAASEGGTQTNEVLEQEVAGQEQQPQ